MAKFEVDDIVKIDHRGLPPRTILEVLKTEHYRVQTETKIFDVSFEYAHSNYILLKRPKYKQSPLWKKLEGIKELK